MTPHKDGRRLHSRYQTDEFEAHLSYSHHGQSGTKTVVKISEISKDSLTCKIASNSLIPLGTKASLEVHTSKIKESLSGTIESCFHHNGHIRVGLLIPNKDLVTLFSHAKLALTPNQRKGSRRNNTSEKSGKREFERRGLWPGLLSKRYFSKRAWELKNDGLYFYMKPLQSGTGAHVIVDGKEMIMMSSNNYLGLSTHPKVTEAAIQAIRKYGSAPSASSLLGGTLDIHIELEQELAKFKGTEAACLFSSGYVTNVTTLTTILGKTDGVFNDDKNHASLIDGSQLSGAEFRAFKHKNVRDLEKKIAISKVKNKLVVTDSVFSMDGDIAPLPELFRICKKYNAALMVDEAHATGVFGKNGKGLLEHFELEGKPEIVMGTLSKSLSGNGGFICGSKELIQILKNTARAFVFSAYVPPSICAAVLACLKIIVEEPERREKLWKNAAQMREGLKNLGFNTGESQSPIIPVIFKTEQETNFMTRGLRESGIYVSPAIYPAVKKNATRVRVTIMATHTEKDIETALAAFKKIRDALPKS